MRDALLQLALNLGDQLVPAAVDAILRIEEKPAALTPLSQLLQTVRRAKYLAW